MHVLSALEAPASLRMQALDALNTPRALAVVRHDDRAPLRLSLGDLLLGLRQRANLTQAQVARAASVSRGLYRHWENDAARPTDAQLHQIGFALGATAEEIVALTARPTADAPMEKTRDAVMDRYIKMYSVEPGGTPEYTLSLLSLLGSFAHLESISKCLRAVRNRSSSPCIMG